jgi:hypothetical protein
MPDTSTGDSQEISCAESVSGFVLPDRFSKAPVRIPRGNWIPRVPQSLFHLSSCLALICIAWAGQMSRVPWVTPWQWAFRLSRWLDPVILQGISTLFVGAIVITYRFPERPLFASLRAEWGKCIGALSLIVGSLFVLFVLERLWLKPAFGYDRPASIVEDSLILHWLGITAQRVGTGCPSGFVMRQVWLLYCGLAIVCSRSTTEPIRYYAYWGWRASFMIAVIFLLTSLVAFLRIARGAHTLFDVGMAIGAGTFLFWFFYFFAAMVYRSAARELYGDMIAFSIAFLCLFTFYSKREGSWIISGFVIVLFQNLVPSQLQRLFVFLVRKRGWLSRRVRKLA